MPLTRFEPEHYATQLSTKVAAFKSAFAAFNLPEPAVYASEPLHYRLRAEFRMWHQDDNIHYAMFDAEHPKRPILLDTFPAASVSICELMPRLRACLEANQVLKDKLFQANFLATLSGELMVTLIYHRQLDEVWEVAARELATELQLQLIGRSRKQKIVIGRDWLLEAFELGGAFSGRRLQYQQIEGSFSQPNGNVNRQMLGWACAQAQDIGGDLLELYCGNGNFTMALAPAFERVLATEVSKSSVQAAHYNLTTNAINNVTMVRMSSDEISDALAGRQQFNRLREIDLATYRFSTLFVDPPRCGLDAPTLELARGFDNILYISCNPLTLQENVSALNDTHHITAAAVFDQFPYTHHLECGLLLTRRAQIS